MEHVTLNLRFVWVLDRRRYPLNAALGKRVEDLRFSKASGEYMLCVGVWACMGRNNEGVNELC